MPNLDGDGNAGDGKGQGRNVAGMSGRPLVLPGWRATERGGHVVTPGLPRCCLPGARPLIPPLIILPLICSIFPKPLIFRMQLRSCEFAGSCAGSRARGGAGQGPGRHSRSVEPKPLAQGKGEGMVTEGDEALLPSLVTAQWAFWECCEPGWCVTWKSWRAGPAGPGGATCPRAPRGSVDVRDHWKPHGHPSARQDPGMSPGGDEWCHSPAPRARMSALHLPVYPCIPLSNTSINLSIHPSVHPSLVHICLSIQPSVHPPELSIRLALPPPRRAASPGGLGVAEPTNTGPTTGGWEG